MKFDGSHHLHAPIARVFAMLNDPSVLQKCIPGCEKMEKTAEDQYNAHLKLGLAAIKGSYVGTVRVTDKDPPRKYTLNIEGKGGPGFVKGRALIELTEAGAQTSLRFSAEAQVGGLIAAVGSRLIEAAGKKMAAEFFTRFSQAVALLVLALAACFAAPVRAEPSNQVVLDLKSTPEHPRNSEGAFVTLNSGAIEFYFNRFYGGFHDESPAQIVKIHSDDRGRTWSEPRLVVDNGKNDNVMDVSLVRLTGGKIALFYSIKKSAWLDCRPYISFSRDEGASWSDPKPVVVAPGYTGTNNDRAIRTEKGRLIMPVPYNRIIGTANEYKSVDWRAITCWYLSDDEGLTWREAPQWWTMPVPSGDGMDEPGVVELADGSLYSWARTDHGEQWACRSRDGGETWTPPVPTELKSPASPASIKRLPHSSTLLAIFNDYSGRFPLAHPRPSGHGRTPLVAALSFDGAKTWPARKLLEDDPDGNFAYTAIHFVDDSVLLAYSISHPGEAHLGQLRIRRISLDWLPQVP